MGFYWRYTLTLPASSYVLVYHMSYMYQCYTQEMRPMQLLSCCSMLYKDQYLTYNLMINQF